MTAQVNARVLVNNQQVTTAKTPDCRNEKKERREREREREGERERERGGGGGGGGLLADDTN